MKVLLYRYLGDPRRVFKTDFIEDETGVAPPIEIDGDLREQSSVIDPVITLETTANLSYYNYAFVDYFRRYYFARFEIVRTGIWRAYLHSDVVANAGYFIAEDVPLGDIRALVGRSEDTSIWSPTLRDNLYPISGEDVIIYVKDRTKPAETGHGFTRITTGTIGSIAPFVLTTAGAKNPGGTDPSIAGSSNATVTSTTFIKSYAMTYSDVQYIADKLNTDRNIWSDLTSLFGTSTENVLTALISLKLFPFDFYTYESSGTPGAIYACNVMLSPGTLYETATGMMLAHNYPVRHFLGSWTIPSLENNTISYLDLQATSVQVYLPFIGLKELNAVDVVGKEIEIVYDIDPVTGDCLVHVAEYYAGDKSKASTSITKPLYMFTGNVSVDIPITKDNLAETQLNRGVQMIGGLTSTAVGVSTGNVAAAIGGLTTFALANWQNQPSARTSGTIGGITSYDFNLNPFFVVRRSNSLSPTDGNMVEYRKTVGLPSMTEMQVSDCRGFTTFAGFRLDHFPFPENELNELEGLFRSGVIFPDPDDPTPPTPPTPPAPPEPEPGELDLLGKYGIDVSEAQAGLTWSDYSAASPEISFAFIRSGIFYDDSSAQDTAVDGNIDALDGHVPVGFYFVPNGNNSITLYNQGAIFAYWVKNKYITPKGKDPQLPYMIDIETGYHIWDMSEEDALSAINDIVSGIRSVIPDAKIGIYSTYIFSQKLPVTIWEDLIFWEAFWGRTEEYADSYAETYTSIIQYGPNGWDDDGNPLPPYPHYTIDGRNVDKDRVLKAWWTT